MGHAARLHVRRELTDEAKHTLVSLFLAGELIRESTQRLGIARESVEEAIREAIRGLAALNQRLRLPGSSPGPVSPAGDVESVTPSRTDQPQGELSEVSTGLVETQKPGDVVTFTPSVNPITRELVNRPSGKFRVQRGA